MVSSRKITRRKFCANFPLLVSAALAERLNDSSAPRRKFNIGDRVIGERLCNDDRSSNYGGIDWEKGNVIGYCWNYPEWNTSELKRGWTYFIRFDEANNPDSFIQPWVDFEHENNLELVQLKIRNLMSDKYCQ